MENNIFEIIGKDTKTGIGRNGETYLILTEKPLKSARHET